jgi:uncharacterized protein YheU (UPF0270 family)
MESESESVDIPLDALSAEALAGVIKSFVLREGTDYGELEFSLEQKMSHVLRQLESGEARIVFDPVSQSVHIMRSDGARPAKVR